MRLVYIAIGWASGIVLSAGFPALPPIFWLVFFATASAILYLNWQTTLRLPLLVLVFFALGANRFELYPTTSDITRYNGILGATIEGQIIAEPVYRDDRVQFRLDTETIILASGTYLTEGIVLVEAPPYSNAGYGDTVRANGRLLAPAEFDTFSYADYLARSNIFSMMPRASIEIVEQNTNPNWRSSIIDLRQNAHAQIQHYLHDPQAALLSGILLGIEQGIDPQLSDDFRATGAAHIIAISGFNMAVISGLVIIVMRRLVPSPTTATLMGISVIALYTIFVGANAGVVRAAFMSSLLVIAPLLRRDVFVPASLAFAAMVMSLMNPTILWDVGFQLSFCAVLGLALFADPLQRQFDQLLSRILPSGTARTAAAWLNEPIVVTVAALILTTPLMIVYFQQLAVLTILVNLLIIPVQTLLLVTGGTGVITSFFLAPLAEILFWITGLLLSWTIGIVRFFADIPFSRIEFAVDPRIVALFYLFVLGAAIVRATQPRWAEQFNRWLRQRYVFNFTLIAGLAFLGLLAAIQLSRPDGLLHVWMLDMGHSHAVLMQSPGGSQVLVDGGRYPSRLLTALGDRLPFYDRDIELVFLTQAHPTDNTALPAVLRRYESSLVLTNGQRTLGETQEELDQILANRDTITVTAGYEIILSDGMRIEVLHPQKTPETGDSFEYGPLVLRVSYRDVSILLPSNLGTRGQQELLTTDVWPRANGIVLPQQGRARSLERTFLDAVQADFAVLQSDPANRRGDPDPDTLAILEEMPLFRTDTQGHIHLYTDGTRLWVVSER